MDNINFSDSKNFNNNNLLNFYEIQNDFLYGHRLNVFDTLLLIKIKNSHNKSFLSGDKASQIMQKSNFDFNPNNTYSYCLISIQDTVSFYSFTIYYEKWGWMPQICLRTYSKKGKFIDEVQLLAKGQDAELKYVAFGNFINDSTYEKRIIEQIINDKNKITSNEISKTYRIQLSGKIIEI